MDCSLETIVAIDFALSSQSVSNIGVTASNINFTVLNAIINIIKILINKCNKQYRKNKKENISYEQNDFENQIKENEIQTDIDFYIIISKLEYVERIIVTLYYLERYTTKEIAKILNKNENTIKTKLSRAKKKLRRYLEEEN